MTAIIGFQIDQQPVVFGDILLSSPIANPSIILPTLKEAGHAIRATYSPAGFTQKVVIVGDRLVIAWSGKYDAGYEVIVEAKRRFATTEPNEQNVGEFLSLCGKLYPDPNDLALVGTIYLGSNRLYQFGYNAWSFTDDRLGVVRTAGSGRDDVTKVLTSLGEIHEASQRLLNPLEKAVGCSLTIAGHLQAFEITTAKNYDNFYGAGYEIATLVQGRWKKIDDILMAYWLAEEMPDGRVSIPAFPERCIRVAYDGDILVMRSLSGLNQNKVEDTIFTIPPVYRSLTTFEQRNPGCPELEARWVCHQFVVRRINGVLSPRSRVTHSSDISKSHLRIAWSGREAEVVMSPGYFELLREFAKPQTAGENTRPQT